MVSLIGGGDSSHVDSQDFETCGEQKESRAALACQIFSTETTATRRMMLNCGGLADLHLFVSTVFVELLCGIRDYPSVL